jgi:enoyl-CoA hydratase/carnithine racemase
VSVRLEIADRVARITIDRPDRLNAVDEGTEVRLDEIWAELETRDDVSCAVLTGAGDKAFSVGADLKNVGASGLEYWAQPRPNGFGGIAFRTSLDVPLIARVNGYALGGGLEMVLGCDIVIASESAQFGLPEGRVGRMPLDGGMVLLQRKIPHNLAMGIMLSGRRFSASEMARFGLVNEIAAPAELDTVVDKWVEDIVACAPLSLRSIKQVVQRTGHMTPAEAQSSRLPALVKALSSEDAKEGVLAFQQKRMPVWQGR